MEYWNFQLQLLVICLPINGKHKFGLFKSINPKSHWEDLSEMKKNQGTCQKFFLLLLILPWQLTLSLPTESLRGLTLTPFSL